MTVAVIFGRALYTKDPLFAPRVGGEEAITATSTSAPGSVTAKKDEHAQITNTHTVAVLVNVNAAASTSAFRALVPVGTTMWIPKLGEGDVIHIKAVS
tara:strand:- start:31667 stop:31960 length:294 start_codon:yes stop_codon:yes gene_type:complete